MSKKHFIEGVWVAGVGLHSIDSSAHPLVIIIPLFQIIVKGQAPGSSQDRRQLWMVYFSIVYSLMIIWTWLRAGKAFGIPIPLLTKYKIGRLLVEGEVVAVKRCYEKSDLFIYLFIYLFS